MPRRLDPKLDVTFKLLFADPDNSELLIALLMAVLQPPSPIVSVEVLNPGLPKNLRDDKGVMLDLLVRRDDGTLAEVEMQSRLQAGLRNRALYYWARMYSAQLRMGMGYEVLQPCTSIFFLARTELPVPRFHSKFQVFEVSTGEKFSDQLSLHIVELPNVPGEEGDEAQLQDWAKFLLARSEKELEETAMRNPMIAKAMRALDRLSADPDAQELARQRELGLADYITDMNASEAKGRAKGRAEGERTGRVASVLAVLAARGIPVSAGQQAIVEACTDIATLDRWIAKAATASSTAEVIASG